MSDFVDPALLEAQREAGWPDMHPEDYCHKCGAPNPMWCADRPSETVRLTFLDVTT